MGQSAAIQKMRSKILDLAIHGKLVVQKEKARMRYEGGIRDRVGGRTIFWGA